MSEPIRRDPVLAYRPGPDSELPLEPGEVVRAVFLPDPVRYWRDHAQLALLGIVAVSGVLLLLGKPDQLWVGAAATVAALLFRAVFFRSETFARRWQLTDRRLIGPQGRQVFLLEIRDIRRLMGDVQIVTRSGAKHLIKHLADAAGAEAAIAAARDARQDRTG